MHTKQMHLMPVPKAAPAANVGAQMYIYLHALFKCSYS